MAIAKPERRSIKQKGQPCVHTKDPLFWCDDCSFQLCLTCFEKSHSGHVIRSYNDFLTERGVKLVTMLGNVDLMILQVSNEMKKLSTDKEKLNSYARTRDEIKKFLGRGDSHEKLSLEIKYLLETGFNAEISIKLENQSLLYFLCKLKIYLKQNQRQLAKHPKRSYVETGYLLSRALHLRETKNRCLDYGFMSRQLKNRQTGIWN